MKKMDKDNNESKFSTIKQGFKLNKGNSRFSPFTCLMACLMITVIAMLLITGAIMMNLLHGTDNWLFRYIKFIVATFLFGANGTILFLVTYLKSKPQNDSLI